MDTYFMLAWLLSIALALFLHCTFTKSKYHLPPGPKKLPVIGNLHQLDRQVYRSLWQLSQKHGPLMHLKLGSRPTVVVSSAEMAKKVLNTQDSDFCSRPKFAVTSKLTYNNSDVVWSSYGEYWRQLRKILQAELFSIKKVESMHEVREEEVALLIRKIYDSLPGPVNLSELMVTYANNMICNVALGPKYHARDYARGELYKKLEGGDEISTSFFFEDYFPWVGRIIDRISGMTRKLDKLTNAFDELYEQVIEEHLDTKRTRFKHQDIVDLLLKYMEDDSVHFSKNQLKAVVSDLIFGGTETTSYTIVWAMAELARNPDMMRRAQDEIRSCVGTRGKVERGDLENLPYLKAVIKETLRLHCLAPLLVPRVATKHCTIAGYDIPPETMVLVNAWGICRDPKTWKDPDEFVPDRFLGRSSIDFRGCNLELIPFGSGRRICPGMNFGVASVELALANLLYHFDWEMPDGMKPEDVNMEDVLGFLIRKKTPLLLVAIEHKM